MRSWAKNGWVFWVGGGVELFIELSGLPHLRVHQHDIVTDCHVGKVESGNLLTLTAWTAFYGHAAARGTIECVCQVNLQPCTSITFIMTRTNFISGKFISNEATPGALTVKCSAKFHHNDLVELCIFDMPFGDWHCPFRGVNVPFQL